MSTDSRPSVRTPRTWIKPLALAVGVLCVGIGTISGLRPGGSPAVAEAAPIEDRIEEGREIFRYDTFGDEQQWTDRLRMHEVIESAIDPLTALKLGLKVDVDALPDQLLLAIAAGAVDLTDPATTLELIRLDAVIGVVGTVEAVDGKARLTRVGVTCALCH